MSPFTLHRQHSLQTACEPTNLRKEKFTTASYFIIYTFNLAATGLDGRKVIHNKKCSDNISLKGMTLSPSIYVLCPVYNTQSTRPISCM